MASYDVFKDGVSLGTSTVTTYSVSSLTAGTTYSMTVKAKDAAGNVSVASSNSNLFALGQFLFVHKKDSVNW